MADGVPLLARLKPAFFYCGNERHHVFRSILQQDIDQVRHPLAKRRREHAVESDASAHRTPGGPILVEYQSRDELCFGVRPVWIEQDVLIQLEIDNAVGIVKSDVAQPLSPGIERSNDGDLSQTETG